MVFFVFSFFPLNFSIITIILVLFCSWGGKNRSVRFFFPLPSPFSPSPSYPQSVSSLVLSRVSVLFGFGFLGLSCSVVVLQMHCDFKASVPVPATSREGSRGPTAGMLGQKVTARAQGAQGKWHNRQMGGGGEGRAAQFGLAGQPPFTQSWRPQPHTAAMLEGGSSRHVPISLPQHETTFPLSQTTRKTGI